ncbi:MAG: RNA polymerase sigma factor [Alphaproteobacteria bacterium]|nr:RNA polymerase sigma factor [Alphaproteobacteria bacterium]
MTDLPDAELITRAKAGDSRAFRALMERHYLLMYKLAYKFCGHKEDAQDVAQEASIKVAEKLHGFKGDSAFTSWLYPIVLNCARDLFRRNSAERVRETAFVEDVALHRGSHGADQEEHAMQAEALQRFAALADDLKSAVLLVASEGMSHKEAGKVLGVAESTVSWRIMKAKQILAGGQS